MVDGGRSDGRGSGRGLARRGVWPRGESTGDYLSGITHFLNQQLHLIHIQHSNYCDTEDDETFCTALPIYYIYTLTESCIIHTFSSDTYIHVHVCQS